MVLTVNKTQYELHLGDHNNREDADFKLQEGIEATVEGFYLYPKRKRNY